MVDVSLPIIDPISGLDMMELDRKTMLTWIDHHKTVMDAANAANFNPEGIREIGKAACELTWEYLFPHEDMPEAVYLLGKYDIWDHADKPRVMPFQYGMKVLNTNPNNQKLWGTLFAGGRSNQNERLVDDIIRDGRLILEYTKQQDKSYAHGYSFDTEVCGKKALAINKGMANSHLFEYVWDNKKYDLMISFCMKRLENGEFVWRCTMYSDKPDVDVGEIAKTFGIRVYTIGVGTHGTAPYPFKTPFGIQYQNMEVQIDEDVLKQIANETDGKYFRATNTSKLKDIYQSIDKLERTKIDVTEFHNHTEEFYPWAIAALLLLVTDIILRQTYLKTLP